jgi:hypothetical protein
MQAPGPCALRCTAGRHRPAAQLPNQSKVSTRQPGPPAPSFRRGGPQVQRQPPRVGAQCANNLPTMDGARARKRCPGNNALKPGKKTHQSMPTGFALIANQAGISPLNTEYQTQGRQQPWARGPPPAGGAAACFTVRGRARSGRAARRRDRHAGRPGLAGAPAAPPGIGLNWYTMLERAGVLSPAQTQDSRVVCLNHPGWICDAAFLNIPTEQSVQITTVYPSPPPRGSARAPRRPQRRRATDGAARSPPGGRSPYGTAADQGPRRETSRRARRAARARGAPARPLSGGRCVQLGNVAGSGR